VLPFEKSLYVPETSRTQTGDIEDGFEDYQVDGFGVGVFLVRFLSAVAGAVGAVGNAGFIGVFQVLWEGAASSRLSIGRQLP
jgi:hypothetical protein